MRTNLKATNGFTPLELLVVIAVYWDSTPFPDGGVEFALGYDPPAGYNYQWSAN
jgi:hypothetical protein